MIYRLFVALLFTFAVFPFVAMYTFAGVYPDAHFAFDQQTWLQGLAPIVFGWVLFLLPGLLPFVGHKYYDWVARKTGFTALFEGTRAGFGRLRDWFVWLRLKSRTALSSRPGLERFRLRQVMQTLRSKSTAAPPPLTEVDEAVSAVPATMPRQSTAAARANVSESLQKARVAIKEAPKHVANVRNTFETLKHRFTPDDLQRTIDLNQYTLETFAHTKGIIRELLAAADLSNSDRTFCNSVLVAIPEPPSPSAVDRPPPTRSFVYPQERREELKQHAGSAKILLRDADFKSADQGDIERGLLIVKAIVARESRERTVVVDSASEELMVGLPAHSSA